MHARSPGLGLLGNAQVDPMGSFVDCKVGLDTKTSPRLAAIGKAQAELRKEYDVQEERKRELEFLEKGGNPLDFKFGRAASVILQSTSFTDQQAEQYVTSEAKGSFVFTASPQGDSVGSSGRLGGSNGREPNTADNLLLFDGENSCPGVEKTVKHTGKRRNLSSLEQSSVDGRTNAKETEDSLMFHLGVKRQAYARRNRSRPSRDSHNNKSTVPSSIPDHGDGNKSVRESCAYNHGILSVSDSKPASPNGNVNLKDEVHAHHASSVEMIKDQVRKGKTDVKIPESMGDSDHCYQQTVVPGEQVANSDLMGIEEAATVGLSSVSLNPIGTIKDPSCAGRVGSIILDKGVTNELGADLRRKFCVVNSIAEVPSLKNIETDTSRADKEHGTVGCANNDNSGMVNSTIGRSAAESKESLIFQSSSDNSVVGEKGLLIIGEAPITGNEQPRHVDSNPSNSVIPIKDEVKLCDKTTDTSIEVQFLAEVESSKTNGEVVLKPKRESENFLRESSHSIDNAGIIASSLVLQTSQPSTTNFPEKVSPNTSAVPYSAGCHSNLAKKAREDAILKKARIIEVNLKRAAQPSSSYKPTEKQRKCHWDFVLEEMKWMANDFMQEHLWKTAAAAHICHQIASIGRSEFENEITCRKQRNIAKTLAKAVMRFWTSNDVFPITALPHDKRNGECNSDLLKSSKANGTTAENDQSSKYVEAENMNLFPALHAYAVQFLKYDCCTSIHPELDNAPSTPERIDDAGIPEKYWEDELSEENLFYRVPPGAMQVYRETMESDWKMSNPMHQEDCVASPSDSVLDGPLKNEYGEEEGETGSYILPGTFVGTMSPNLTRKKRKKYQQNLHASRVYNVASDYSYEPILERKPAKQTPMFSRKRASNIAGSIPTKRARTAARPRVIGPTNAAGTEHLQITNKTDASSTDTNSLRDDQSSMYGGSQSWRNMEVESSVDYDKQLLYDGSEISTKSKKENSKHLGHSNYLDSSSLAISGRGSMLDQRLQSDSLVQHEQRDQGKKRLESQHFESNGKIVTYGQQGAKRPRISKQLTEHSPETVMPASASTHSPVTSQMSYMSNQSKLIKIVANRDRGKKSKASKVSAQHSGSGNIWSTLEEQALVVLVHDMGPYWELISDAMNSTLQFKRIFRKPNECKEHHKFLMEKSAGYGAACVEDSGSSQPYPSTLPGIPKGNAIPLFQRLQGPMEEDTLKAHFEKIISIGQRLPSCRNQKDTVESKRLTPVHISHDAALSQTYPNNLTGGVLSPLGLCDATSSSPDVLSIGYDSSHTNGAALPNHQGSISPAPTTTSVNSMLQGSPSIVLGSNISSPSTPSNAPSMDAQRYSIPGATLLADDRQRAQYIPMLSGKNIQQPSLSMRGAFLPTGVDRGAYILPNGNTIGMTGGWPMPMARPGFQGINSPGMPMVSTGSTLASSGITMLNAANTHSIAVSSPGNSMLRPQDALPLLRPGQNMEDHRLMMMQDFSPQISQGNPNAMPPFNSMSAPFSIASVHSFPTQQHPQRPHIQTTNNSNPHQQAYSIHLAKERQLQQQRMMPHSQLPYSPSTSSAMPPIQNNNSQTQHNQILKQRQGQQQQQQQKPKVVKGLSRGATMMHHNLAVDPRNQGFFPNPNHQKLYFRPPSQSSSLPSSSPLASPLQQQQHQINQNLKRLMLQNNQQLKPNGRMQYSSDQVQKVNQMSSATSAPNITAPARSSDSPEENLIPFLSEGSEQGHRKQQPQNLHLQAVKSGLYAHPSNLRPSS